MKKITYSKVGDNYVTKDPVKKLAQVSAKKTAQNLKTHEYKEISDSRGESAYVWQQGNILMASVIEGLGTKNLVADETRKITGKTYYDVIGHDTVACIVNDLISVGATPLVLHAYWAIEDNSWLQDEERMKDFIFGWEKACDLAGVSWGGGETPTLKGIVVPNTVDLGGSAVGIIKPAKRLITDRNLKVNDQILLLKSKGINANGLSLARAVAGRLTNGYATKLPSGKIYGEALLQKINIYTNLLEKLFQARVNLHYLSNITGHGLRKIMRARQNFTYVIEKTFEPPEIFPFIQRHAHLSDKEMYETFNMGQDYTLFLPEKDMEKAQKIVEKYGFESLAAGRVEKGGRQVIIKPKNIVYKAETLNLR